MKKVKYLVHFSNLRKIESCGRNGEEVWENRGREEQQKNDFKDHPLAD